MIVSFATFSGQHSHENVMGAFGNDRAIKKNKKNNNMKLEKLSEFKKKKKIEVIKMYGPKTLQEVGWR